MYLPLLPLQNQHHSCTFYDDDKYTPSKLNFFLLLWWEEHGICTEDTYTFNFSIISFLLLRKLHVVESKCSGNLYISLDPSSHLTTLLFSEEYLHARIYLTQRVKPNNERNENYSCNKEKNRVNVADGPCG